MAIKVLHYVAAAATATGGTLHLVLASNMLRFSSNSGILFLIGGLAQLFWVVPMIRRWGKPWYYIGIGGTAVLVSIYFITRMPGNPITGRGGSINAIGAVTEIAQLAFISLCFAIVLAVTGKKEEEEEPVRK